MEAITDAPRTITAISGSVTISGTFFGTISEKDAQTCLDTAARKLAEECRKRDAESTALALKTALSRSENVFRTGRFQTIAGKRFEEVLVVAQGDDGCLMSAHLQESASTGLSCLQGS